MGGNNLTTLIEIVNISGKLGKAAVLPFLAFATPLIINKVLPFLNPSQ